MAFRKMLLSNWREIQPRFLRRRGTPGTIFARLE